MWLYTFFFFSSIYKKIYFRAQHEIVYNTLESKLSFYTYLNPSVKKTLETNFHFRLYIANFVFIFPLLPNSYISSVA